MFKMKVTHSKILPEVKFIQPKPFHDYRGEMWTFWEKANEVLPKRNKMLSNKVLTMDSIFRSISNPNPNLEQIVGRNIKMSVTQKLTKEP